MSKIEKALRRAEEDMKLPVRRPSDEPAPTQPPAGPAGDAAAEAAPAAETAKQVAPFDSRHSIRLMRQPERLSPGERSLRKIIVPDATESASVKALREIRTKIVQRTAGSSSVIMVTGLSPGSGATFNAVNLATAFALDAARTALLIDCNLRRPYLGNLVSGAANAGLTDYLMEEKDDLADIIHPTGVERLRVIPVGTKAGPGNEYFTLERMRQLIWSVRERYADRQIIMDCPPLSRSVDTQILMGLCDYVVLVVPYGKISESQLKSALGFVDARKLLGVVFNNEPSVPDVSVSASMSSLTKRILPAAH